MLERVKAGSASSVTHACRPKRTSQILFSFSPLSPNEGYPFPAYDVSVPLCGASRLTLPEGQCRTLLTAALVA